jgi:hypothetical protein
MEDLVIHRGIIQHDLTRCLNCFSVEKHNSKTAIVGILRTSSENYHTIAGKLFQAVEMFRDNTRFNFGRTIREHVMTYWLYSVKKLTQSLNNLLIRRFLSA